MCLLLCIHLIMPLFNCKCSLLCMFKTCDFAVCCRALKTTCMLQNPDEPRYMTTCLQRDNVKLNVVFNCSRLVLICVVMQKRCVENVQLHVETWLFSEKGLCTVCFSSFLPHCIPIEWCNGWELIFWTQKPYVCLYYRTRVTSNGSRPRLWTVSWEYCWIDCKLLNVASW